DSEAFTHIIAEASEPICIRSAVETTKPPAYPFIIINVKERRRQNKPRRQSTSDPVRLIFQISESLKAAPPPLNPVTVAVPLR
ncbi:hypothetical protein, partial [Cereibacter sphaeroides]|uniref:hypothetical protein n=1 Tax=Cereibacter sphaeroides TaxID=1063 RepID=UPI0039F1494A